MARDMHEVMVGLGHGAYSVVGHDRGGRVAHRLALDQPQQAVTRLCVLDIVPTHTVFARTDRHLAAAYWHWFFFQCSSFSVLLSVFFFQAPDLPELMISASAEPFLRHLLRSLTYRAGAIDCPVLTLWGEQGKIHTIFDVLATWREKANRVDGHSLPCGHFFLEEVPDDLLAALRPFLREPANTERKPSR